MAAELLVGTATVNITPDQPIALQGQMHTRIGRAVDSPLEASVVVIESRQGEKPLDQVIMVSCDVCYLPSEVVQQVRKRLNPGHRSPRCASGRCGDLHQPV
jgi:hypothetical protein